MGQAFVQLSNRAFAMLQMEVDLNQFASVRRIFEAVIESLHIQDPKQLDQQRQTQIAQGKAWHQAVDPKRLAQSIRPEQWLRVGEGRQTDGLVCSGSAAYADGNVIGGPDVVPRAWERHEPDR